MPIMTWSDELSVGIASLDEQHKEWIRIINALFDAMKAGKGKEALGGLLADVVTFARGHFAAEEKHMRETEYAEFHVHVLQHTAFLAKMDELLARWEKGDLAVSIDTMNTLKDWVVQHVNTVDKRYGPHLAGKGIR